MKKNIHLLMLALALITVSCTQSPAQEAPESSPLSPTITITSPTEETEDLPESLPAPDQSGETAPEALPAQPREIKFDSSDGETLSGIYYPAAGRPAPLVVLMHWYPGDQLEWEEIAFWLQNRGLSGGRSGSPWLDSSWFPDMPRGASLGVFSFTFRHCEGGCREPEPGQWLLDARAALEEALQLPGVDADRIVVIGASIGGDAAADSCAWFTEQSPPGCQGVLSLSPGNFLNNSYRDAADSLGKAAPPRQVWCFYDENEEVAAVCQEPTGAHFHSEGWSNGNLHGMRLITPDLDPGPLEQMLLFLSEAGMIP